MIWEDNKEGQALAQFQEIVWAMDPAVAPHDTVIGFFSSRTPAQVVNLSRVHRGLPPLTHLIDEFGD